MFTNKNLLILGLIAFVNMLGYGIVIPIIYSYSKRFGLSDFQNGLLFASFSIAQFISTPIIGRLSDKYGRKPLLLFSIIGTALSFFTLAFAPNALILFLGRILDGLTAGDIPVAFAIISDTTKPQERTRSFGIIGAAFGFGFVFGPAISALTLNFGASMPFIVAGSIALVAVFLTAIFLHETNQHMGEVQKAPLFDFPKLWNTLFEPNVGITFLISLIFNLAFSLSVVYGFQPFTIKVLHITAQQNAELFAMVGFIGLLSQALIVSRVTKAFGIKRTFSTSIVLMALSFILMFLSRSLSLFITASILFALSNSIVQTLILTILSQEADQKSQGSIMGLNSSYQSIGTIFGPLLGGAIATVSIPATFLAGAVLMLFNYVLSLRILGSGAKKESAFSPVTA